MTPQPLRAQPLSIPQDPTRAVVDLACLASDCYRLAAELRTNGVHPRTRLLCSSVITQMLALAPAIEAVARNGRPDAVETREVKKVKRALGKVA